MRRKKSAGAVDYVARGLAARPVGGGGTGTVTSVSGTGTVAGITLSGTVTESGSLTLDGELDIGTVPITSGGTGETTAQAARTALLPTQVGQADKALFSDGTDVEFRAIAIPVAIVVAASDEDTPLTTGAAKVSFRMPHAMTLTSVRASLKTAQAAGDILTVDINEAGASILSTKLTIDNTEKTSTTATTPAVVSDIALADDAEITVDIDQIGDGSASGLKISLIGVLA